MEDFDFPYFFNQLREKAIADVIPKDEIAFIEAARKIYAFPEITSDDPMEFLLKHGAKFMDVDFDKIKKEYSALRNDKYTKLFMRLYNTMIIYFFKSPLIQDEIKKEAGNYFLSEVAENLHSVFPELGSIENEQLDFIKNKVTKLISNSHSISNSVQNTMAIKTRNNSLFNVNVPELERLLIEKEFINKGLTPLEKLFISEWPKNTQSVDWLKNQQSLLYLLYLLNDGSLDIENGNILDVIYQTFTIKSKLVSYRNISKSYSKMVRVYIIKKSLKNSELKMIDFIFHNAKSSPVDNG